MFPEVVDECCKEISVGAWCRVESEDGVVDALLYRLIRFSYIMKGALR